MKFNAIASERTQIACTNKHDLTLTQLTGDRLTMRCAADAHRVCLQERWRSLKLRDLLALG